MSLPKYLSTRLIEVVSEIVDFKLKQRGVFKNPMETIMEPQSIKFGVGGDTKGGKNNLSQQEHLPNFDDFWDKCPRKIAKGSARMAYKAALMKATPEEIISSMGRYARSCVGKDPKFICHPSTWLNQERWSDELVPIGGPPPEEEARRHREGIEKQLSVRRSNWKDALKMAEKWKGTASAAHWEKVAKEREASYNEYLAKYATSETKPIQEREAILRRITALEKERGVRAREFDTSRVREIDEQLDLERRLLKDHA